MAGQLKKLFPSSKRRSSCYTSNSLRNSLNSNSGNSLRNSATKRRSSKAIEIPAFVLAAAADAASDSETFEVEATQQKRTSTVEV